MSANDNILAGLAGAAEGIAGVYVPWAQNRQRAVLEDQLARNRIAEQSQAEINQKKVLLPYEEESKIRTEQALQSAQAQKSSQLETQKDTMKGSQFNNYTRRILGLEDNKDYRISEVGKALDNYTKANASRPGERIVQDVYQPGIPRPAGMTPDMNLLTIDQATKQMIANQRADTSRQNTQDRVNATTENVNANTGLFRGMRNQYFGVPGRKQNGQSAPGITQPSGGAADILDKYGVGH